jgi:hypothetical protein
LAAAAVQAMLDYKPHTGTWSLPGLDRPRGAAFLISNDKDEQSPGLRVDALPGDARDLAAGGLRAAPKGQAFDDSNNTVITCKILGSCILVDRVMPPVSEAKCIFSREGTKRAQDIKPRAVGVAHPIFGAALADALSAAVEGTGLHAGFTWAAWPFTMKRTPCWVLWW